MRNAQTKRKMQQLKCENYIFYLNMNGIIDMGNYLQ